jgi:hypothetical protein
MEGVGNSLCPFCNTYLSVDLILWESEETEDQRMEHGHEKRTMNQREQKYEKDN